MIPTFVRPYSTGETDGELRIGWASWDDGSYTSRSIKWAYRDKSGKISRGSPELPFDILADMVILAVAKGELSQEQIDTLRTAICQEDIDPSAVILINNATPTT